MAPQIQCIDIGVAHIRRLRQGVEILFFGWKEMQIVDDIAVDTRAGMI